MLVPGRVPVPCYLTTPWPAQAAAEGGETGPPDGGRDMHFLLGNCSGKFIDMESGLAGLDVQLQRTKYWRDVEGVFQELIN